LIPAVLLLLFALAGCGGSDGGGTTPPLPDKVAGAPVTWGEPSGGNPKAVVMLIHGGGWQPSRFEYEGQKEAGKSLNGQGYATVAIAYDTGAKGFKQIVATYRVARKHYPDLPICANGISAGGHLALMLATREPDLACVETLSAPTDLTTLAQQDPSGDEGYQAAVEAFGRDQLAKFSPARYADRIKARVLMVIAASDPAAPVAQGEELADALPGAQLMVVPPGPVPVPWAHFGGVQPDAQDQVLKRQLDFLDSVAQ
jgi:dipeptidyl aminopeptidase/acylaminoacyl peptidase